MILSTVCFSIIMSYTSNGAFVDHKLTSEVLHEEINLGNKFSFSTSKQNKEQSIIKRQTHLNNFNEVGIYKTSFGPSLQYRPSRLWPYNINHELSFGDRPNYQRPNNGKIVINEQNSQWFNIHNTQQNIRPHSNNYQTNLGNNEQSNNHWLNYNNHNQNGLDFENNKNNLYWGNNNQNNQGLLNNVQNGNQLTTNNSFAFSQRNACNLRCRKRVTFQYDPVCGTDDITYQNRNYLNCMKECGIVTEMEYFGKCVTTTQRILTV
ncbi:probable serine/threonine-protein kinase clkA isoform X2 [Daktulosphaira vitifoliae]|uniref:probable serine/threonine-protein kinase clkA isoform X1 n=1 Tax=Daktulosphaira vitifoliae TaxID=58002 RepID=UPI0021AAC052|nr:probable serine/threonine-protein kinase clkA isoform X1 [Daktulosphaira vitifoliae]XP_050546854.1 probable serine/threonine-protein kinase clkA isoform X2 [Daktulosphaira vitifoliae]